MTTEIKKDLAPLFCPRSIAVIGASTNPFKMGHNCVKSLVESRFKGKIYIVNNKGEEVLGIRPYRSITEIPERIDLAIIAIPAQQVPEALRNCALKGAKGAVIITAGFSELGREKGEKLNRRLVEIASLYDIKIIGPNTFGMCVPHSGLNASFTPAMGRISPGSIAMISQSGGVAHMVAFQAIREKIGMSMLVGLGNRCNVDFHHMFEFLAEDDKTEIVCVYIEGLDDIRKTFAAARKLAAKKPVIVYKGGVTKAADSPSRSHTGSMAGRAELYSGGFRQAGMLEIERTEEFLDTAKLLAVKRNKIGQRVAIISVQAGPSIIITDLVVRSGLKMAAFSDETQKRINRLIPPMTMRTNPVDAVFLPPPRNLKPLVTAMNDDPGIDVVIIFSLVTTSSLLEPMLNDLKRTACNSTKQLIFCTDSPDAHMLGALHELIDHGLAVYTSPFRAVAALKNAYALEKIRESATVRNSF